MTGLPSGARATLKLSSAEKRFLLISPAFPPSSYVGALRWQKMLPFLDRAGWYADVATIAPDALDVPDTSRLREIPGSARVFSIPQRDPAFVRALRGVKSASRRIGSAMRPAAGKSMAADEPPDGMTRRLEECLAITRPTLRQRFMMRLEQSQADLWAEDVEQLVRTQSLTGVRAVVSSGPPHYAHIAGRRVAAMLSVPLILDLRDPWAHLLEHPASVGCAQYIQWLRTEERRAFAAARWIVANTTVSTERYREAHPDLSLRLETVWNGADSDPIPPVSRPNTPFIMAYAGSMYHGRTPVGVFAALSRVVKRLGLSPGDIRFELMGVVGHVDGIPTMDLARHEGVDQYVVLRPNGKRDEARRFLASAHMLVSLPWPGGEQVPAKIYEYADFPAELLVLAEPDTAPAFRLAGTSALVVASEDGPGIELAIEEAFARHRSGEQAMPANAGGLLSREREANKFAALLDRTVDAGAHA